MNSVEHLDDIPLDLPLYIYGAGEGGRFLLDQLRSAGRHEVLGFVDSFKTGDIDGMPILPVDALLESRGGRAWRIAIATGAYAAVARNLAERGVEDVVNAYPFIQRHIYVLPISGDIRPPPARLPAEIGQHVNRLREHAAGDTTHIIDGLEQALARFEEELAERHRREAPWFLDAIKWRLHKAYEALSK